ncbi:hypothetical protein HDU97_002794 [Phlyctochytrium planicorne]|nr:hypothetical protein HDU97_002794 [Phlyctochytrium planicorne]
MTLPSTSKAVVFRAYGGNDVFSYEDVPTPTLHGHHDDHFIIVKIEAGGVNPVDYKIRNGDVSLLFPVTFPATLGSEYAGRIVAVGPKVEGWKVGDEVYGKTAMDGKGSYAEYMKVDTKHHLIVKRPSHFSPVQAAGVGIVALTAYVALVDFGGLSSTDFEANSKKHVLIVGASGGVGSWGVLLAKKLDAKVTAIASGKNKDFVLNTLKADKFVDYTVAPLEEHSPKRTNSTPSSTLSEPHGTISSTVGTGTSDKFNASAIAGMIGGNIWKGLTSNRKYRFITSSPNNEFKLIAQWIEEKAFPELPVTTFPLKDAAKALSLSESKRVVGKIVLVP